jgi:hypothetical protein
MGTNEESNKQCAIQNVSKRKPKYVYRYGKWCTEDDSACVGGRWCDVDTTRRELSRCKKCGRTNFH